MPRFDLMSDTRFNQLTKAAEETVGLLNIGIDPNAALLKVADDFAMSDKEVTLVSQAVNNSKQLAQLQTANVEDKDAPFPLTNADVVVKLRNGEQNPDVKSIPDSVKQKLDEPDSVEIKNKLDKAAEASYDFPELRKAASVDTALLRTAFGSKAAPVESLDRTELDLFAKLGEYDTVVEDACITANRAVHAAEQALDSLAMAFTRIDRPVSFQTFEKLAQAQGVSAELLDIVFQRGNLGELMRDVRNTEPLTKRAYCTAQTMELLKQAQQAQELFETAVNYRSAATILKEKAGDVQASLNKLAESKSESKSFFNLSADPLKMEGLEKLPGQLLGAEGADISERIMEASGVKGDAAEYELPYALRQDIKNVDTRTAFENAKEDPYIKGYKLPEIVDAFNQAMATNARMGPTELINFMRQHLATQGAMPLDILAKIRGRDAIKETKYAD